MMNKVHIAIMKKSWGLTEKILTGDKTIESRWYTNKSRPWGNITKGDSIYFKDSGSPVTVRAKVKYVLQIDNLNPEKVRQILVKYTDEGLGIDKEKVSQYYQNFKNKKYCILVFLENPERVSAFNINKTGYGTMSAWITTDNIQKVKLYNVS